MIGWIALGEDALPSSDGGLVSRRLHALTDFAGVHLVLAALGVAAILLGSLVPSVRLRAIADRLKINSGHRRDRLLNSAFGLSGELQARDGGFDHWLYRVTAAVPETIDWQVFDRSECPPSMQTWARDVREATDENSSLAVPVKIRRKVVRATDLADASAHSWLLFYLAPESVREELYSELPMRLQIERDALYNDWDRVQSEGSLRAAIIVPTLILTGLLATTSLWWLMAAAVPAWMLRQGVRARVEADQILHDAVRYGAITSSTVEFVRSLYRTRRSDDPTDDSTDEDSPRRRVDRGEALAGH